MSDKNLYLLIRQHGPLLDTQRAQSWHRGTQRKNVVRLCF